jgi:hypothetical protein
MAAGLHGAALVIPAQFEASHPASDGHLVFCNGPLGVNPFLHPRRRIRSSVRGQRSGRHIILSEGTDEPI